jgi:hypothetical protein
MVLLDLINVFYLDVRVEVFVLVRARLILAIHRVILRVCGLLCRIIN